MSPKSIQWVTGSGSVACSPVLSTFTDEGKRFYVVRVARGMYDAGEPYAAIAASEATAC